MSAVLEASIAIKDSKSFKELLKFILVMGNFMNGTTFQGGAFGIRIASINKLVDTKGTEGNTTLLHFLVDSVESKFPRLHGFLDDLQESGNACRGEKKLDCVLLMSVFTHFLIIFFSYFTRYG
jgi:cytokinesis protein